MRSRYTANAVGDADHLFRTWHPRTRPDDVRPDPTLHWIGLQVLATAAGGSDDDTGVVEFEASWEQDGSHGLLRERSTFARRAGRWLYVDGEVS